MNNNESYEGFKEEKDSSTSRIKRNFNIKYFFGGLIILAFLWVVIKTTPSLKDTSFYPFIIIFIISMIIISLFGNEIKDDFPDDSEFVINLLSELKWRKARLEKLGGYSLIDGNPQIEYTGVDNPEEPHIKVLGFFIENEKGWKKYYYVIKNRNFKTLATAEGKYKGEFMETNQYRKFYEKEKK